MDEKIIRLNTSNRNSEKNSGESFENFPNVIKNPRKARKQTCLTNFLWIATY